jgi:(2Fe-2S) ferredoxin
MNSLKNNYYKTHIFICTNVKESGKCCGKEPIAKQTVSQLKKQVKELDVGGEGNIRISSSGCMGRCSEGPVAVSYPTATWYNLLSSDDLKNLFNLITPK